MIDASINGLGFILFQKDSNGKASIVQVVLHVSKMRKSGGIHLNSSSLQYNTALKSAISIRLIAIALSRYYQIVAD